MLCIGLKGAQHENSTYHRRKRLQRRSRYSGGYQDNDHERRFCHERYNCAHSAEHDRRFGDRRSLARVLRQQLDAVFEDIYPDAVKIGMVSSSELIRVIADRLRHYDAKNIVVDPVMVATSGSALMKTDAVQTLADELFPISTVITPNIPEGEILSGMKIENEEDMLKAAEKIGREHGCAVLLKGGHSVNDANDLLYSDGECCWFEGRRIDNPNTHGTGCTLSSAIASNLAKGYDLKTSVRRAKEYISGALAAMLDLGRGRGPMNHAFALSGEFSKEA